MEVFSITTRTRDAFIPITERITKMVDASGIDQGMCTVFVPHTTAGVTINENADPSVTHDLIYQLDKMVPWHDPNFRHGEGNSAAHLKASMVGSSITMIIDGGKLRLGTWQGIYFCEFDGPRTRRVWVHCR